VGRTSAVPGLHVDHSLYVLVHRLNAPETAACEHRRLFTLDAPDCGVHRGIGNIDTGARNVAACNDQTGKNRQNPELEAGHHRLSSNSTLAIRRFAQIKLVYDSLMTRGQKYIPCGRVHTIYVTADVNGSRTAGSDEAS